MQFESSDFFGRLESFFETFGFGGVTLMIVGTAIVFSLAFWRGAGFVLGLLLLGFIFSPVRIGGMIYAATLLRWFCLALMAILAVKRFRLPSPPIFLFMFPAVLGVIFAVTLSSHTYFSLQKGLLKFTIVFFLPIAVSGYIVTTEQVRTIFKVCIGGAAVWTVTHLVLIQDFLRGDKAMRFSYGGEAATAVDAGAYLAPFVVWGIVQARSKRLRWFCLAMLVPFLVLLLFSGKRAAMAGQVIIPCIPLLLVRTSARRILGFLTVGGLALVSTMLTFSYVSPEKAARLIDRFMSTGLTGREILWAHGLRQCLENPFMGHGEGAADLAGIGVHGFHNGYLIIWYDTGLLGLLSVVAFLLIYTARAWRLCRKAPSNEVAEYGRIALGFMLGVIAVGFFVGRLGGAANLNNCMLLVLCVVVDRLNDLSTAQKAYDWHYADSQTPWFAGTGSREFQVPRVPSRSDP